MLQDIGYRLTTSCGWSLPGDIFIFDIFIGDSIYTTTLLESPFIKKNHFVVREFSHINLGVLNDYDLIISKLFRGTQIDSDDCLSLIQYRKGSIDMSRLEQRFRLILNSSGTFSFVSYCNV